MNSLDRDIPTVGATVDSSQQNANKQELLSLGLDQSIPEFNIQLSEGWSALDWETKAANASLPYTPSYASFNSPGSNLSALSGPYDDNDLEYLNSASNNANPRGYTNNMDESEQYNPLDFSTGTDSFPLIDATLGEADEFLASATSQTNPRLQITEPQYLHGQSQYQNQLYTAHRATPEHSPSPASSAGEMEQRNYTGGAAADGVGASHHPSPMIGNILPPAGFSEGLANLNFGAQVHGGAQSPPEGTATFTFQQQVSRVPTPISVPSNDEPGSQHPSASASSPGTPGSMSAQRPIIITETLTSLASPPIPSSSSEGPSGAYLDPHSQQGGSGDAPNILLIPSSPGEQQLAQATTQSQQSPDSSMQQQPQRPPGLHDFLSGSMSSSLAGPSAPNHPWALGHRPRSHSHSDVARLNQPNQLGMGGMSYPHHLNASIYANAGSGTGVANNNLLGTTTSATSRSWQDPNIYSGYPFANQGGQPQSVNRTVNPNEAFGGQQVPMDTSAFDNLLRMPPSPEHGTTSLPLNAHPTHPGIPSYNSAPLLSVTQPLTSSSMAATQSSPGSQQHSPAPSHSSASTAGPSYFQTLQSTLAPPTWQPNMSGGAMLRRYKTTGSAPGSGHRRSAFSEDIHYDRRGAVSQSDFVRNITAPDGSLLPPSGSSTSPALLSNSSSPAPMLGGGVDSLGLGLGGHYASSASPPYGIDDEYVALNGGTGPTRGRRRTSSAASERSPYQRPLSISPSRSPNNFAQPNDFYNQPGSGVNSSEVLPATSVERQHVTTPATELASQSRRKNKAPFTCPVEGCGSTFTRQFNLKGHLRSHREERPYVCKWPKCGKGFARQHDCKRHEALHLNIRPFTCEGCGKTFARMDALNRHHKSEGGVECRHTATTDLDGASGGGASGGSSNDDVYGGYKNDVGGGSWGNRSYIA